MIRTEHICDRCGRSDTSENPAGHLPPVGSIIRRKFRLGEAEIEADLCHDCNKVVQAMIDKCTNDIRASLVPLHQPAAAT